MNFEDIDTSLLRNSINQCLESINYNNSENILQNIQDNNIWNTASRDTFKKALDKIVNEDYKKLEKKLNDFLEVVDIIEKYKEVNNGISESAFLSEELSQKLIAAENNYSTYKKENKLDSEEALENQKLIDDLKKQVDDNNKKIENDNIELLKIKNSIEKLLG